MAYEAYNIFNAYRSITPRTSMKDAIQNKIDQDFQISPNYTVIKIKDRVSGVFTDIGVRIENYGVETSFYANDEYKRIIFQDMDYMIRLGDIVEFSGYRWLVMQPKSINSSTSSAIIQRCNCVLRFTESTPLTENIIVIDCIASNKMNFSLDNRVIDIPDGSLFVTLPLDSNGLKIKLLPKPTRFLLGLPDYRGLYRAWEVENIDTITNARIDYYASTPMTYMGIMNLFLKQSSIDKNRDDHTVGVCYQNYF
jgi:hypothetical protein